MNIFNTLFNILQNSAMTECICTVNLNFTWNCLNCWGDKFQVLSNVKHVKVDKQGVGFAKPKFVYLDLGYIDRKIMKLGWDHKIRKMAKSKKIASRPELENMVEEAEDMEL